MGLVLRTNLDRPLTAIEADSNFMFLNITRWVQKSYLTGQFVYNLDPDSGSNVLYVCLADHDMSAYTSGFAIMGYVNGNLTNIWSKVGGSSGNFYNLIDAPVVVIDFAKSNNFNFILDGTITSGGGRTLGIPLNISPGQAGIINVWQPDINRFGLSTIAYAWCWEFKNGVAPVLTNGSFSCDQLVYCVNYYIHSNPQAVVLTDTASNIVCLSHGLISGMQIQFYNISDTTNLSENTTYFVYVIDEDTFNIYPSMLDLQNGSGFITISAANSVCFATMVAISINITANFNITSNSDYDSSIINY